MSSVLSIIAFVVLSFISFTCVTGKRRMVNIPFSNKQKMLLSGGEFFVVMLFATGLFGCGPLLSTRLIVSEVFCLLVIFKYNSRVSYSFPMILYILYLCWIVIGCYYSESFSYGLRVVVKYIYPLLVTVVCLNVVTDYRVFLRAGLDARIVALFAAIIGVVPALEYNIFRGLMWYGTARAINFIAICIFSAALYFHLPYERKKNRNYAFLFMLPCVLWVFRTSIMGTLFAISVFSFFKWKIRSVPIILGIGIIGVASVFMIPRLNQKMFHDNDIMFSDLQSGGIEESDINTNGRTWIWEMIEQQFYKGHELYGSGTGTVQQEMYEHSEKYGDIRIPHNDYLQMRCDNGLVGLVLYLMAMIGVVIHCFQVYNSPTSGVYTKVCAITAGSALAGMLLTLCTDNTVNYSMCTLSYPMGFYGMMLGLVRTEKGSGGIRNP